MYDKLHAELAPGNQQLLLFITFIIFIIVFIIQEVLHLVYYRQMHTQKFIQFFQEKFLSQSISKIFLMPKPNHSSRYFFFSFLNSDAEK